MQSLQFSVHRDESDTTEQLHFHLSLSYVGEGNGNPLQCSCLENPRLGGAWWPDVYWVSKRRTRLKRRSSSSIDLLSMVLRCNGFAGIQKAVVDQTGSRPPESGCELVLVQVCFEKCFGASSQSNHPPQDSEE